MATGAPTVQLNGGKRWAYAPDLEHINRKFSIDALARWLRNPAAQVPNAHMPKLELTDHEVDALVIYLASPR